MQCRDIMTKYLKLCRPECTARDAVKIMSELNCGSVPIVNEDNEPVGIVTDRDTALYIIMNDRNPKKTKVEDFMTRDVITVNASEDVDTAINKMKEYKIRRVPICDDSNRIVGIISLGDIAVTSGEEHETFDALETISFPISGAK